jgi:hypothetical protein
VATLDTFAAVVTVNIVAASGIALVLILVACCQLVTAYGLSTVGTRPPDFNGPFWSALVFAIPVLVGGSPNCSHYG